MVYMNFPSTICQPAPSPHPIDTCYICTYLVQCSVNFSIFCPYEHDFLRVKHLPIHVTLEHLYSFVQQPHSLPAPPHTQHSHTTSCSTASHTPSLHHHTTHSAQPHSLHHPRCQ